MTTTSFTGTALRARMIGLDRKTAITRPTATTTTSRLLSALRLVPAAFLLAGVITSAPSALATGCHIPPSRILIDGGTSRNATNVNLSANGGTITLGNINAGGNTGNVIETGS